MKSEKAKVKSEKTTPLLGGVVLALAVIAVFLMVILPVDSNAQTVDSSQNTYLNPSPEGSGQALSGETYPQLEEYLQIAIEKNPELQALWHGYQAELEMIPQVSTLPDPEVSLGYTINPMMSDGFLSRFSASAMQMFPWFGTLNTMEEMQKASAEATYQKLNSRQLELLRDIQTTWLDLSELNLKIEITQETIKLVSSLESLVEIRYETSRTGLADLLRIQMEEERLKTMIENLEDRKNPLREMFNAFLNRDLNARVLTASRLELMDIQSGKDDLISKIQQQNPVFSELDAREQMLQQQRKKAQLDGRPGFGMGLEVMGRSSAAMSMFPDSREMFVGMATVRIPLYRGRYKAQYRQVEEQLKALDYQRIQSDNRLLTELEQRLEKYRESERSILLLDEELIPRATQALEILSAEYSAGRTGFDEVLRLQELLLNLELEHIERLAEQNIAYINIQALVGGVDPYQQVDETP